MSTETRFEHIEENLMNLSDKVNLLAEKLATIKGGLIVLGILITVLTSVLTVTLNRVFPVQPVIASTERSSK